MVNWQITAATFKCDLVNDEVTLLVHKDWSIQCTGQFKYGPEVKLPRSKAKTSSCIGTDCALAAEYRRKLQAEEVK